jgi:protein-L-isoaspartate(D-aspartate) O-methyltransferase
MKAHQVILLLLGGMALAAIQTVGSENDAYSSAPASATNAGAAYGPQDSDAVAPAEQQIIIQAARQRATNSGSPRMMPPSMQSPEPRAPQMQVGEQGAHGTRREALLLPSRPIPPTVMAGPSTNGLPTVRRSNTDALFAAARERMVAEQLAGRGIANAAVLDAMRTVPRHQFVYSEVLSNSYVDLTLVFSRTAALETPYVIAVTAEQLAAHPGDRILDVEAGAAYDAAVFSLLVKEVYVTEPLPSLAEGMRSNLERLGYTNNLFVQFARVNRGWPEAAPFDTIVFNYPLDQFPESLLDQLKPGGRLIIPVSDDGKMYLLTKTGAQLSLQKTLPVRPTPIPGNQLEIPSRPALLQPRPQ